MSDTAKRDAVLQRYVLPGRLLTFSSGGPLIEQNRSDVDAMADRIVALEDKVTTLEAALNTAGQFAVGDLAPRMVKLEQLLSALENPDYGTVMAALDAEWSHFQSDQDATRQTGARAGLVGVAKHLREQLGL